MRKIDLTNFQVATSETARQVNRRIALNFLRRHQPMSRADLARRSGLQRSTVSSIVDQLIEEGWVTEGAVGRTLRGRRPRLLHLNAERGGIIGIELRPESTTTGLATLDARFLGQTHWATPRDPEQFVAQAARSIAGLRRAHPAIVCEGMGVSVPGRIDSRGRIIFAPNLAWPLGFDLAGMLEAATGLPVFLENAANACALAEVWFGHYSEDVSNLLAVTVSEGIGVGLIVNRQLVHGAEQMAGEFGHVSLNEQGPECRCGKRGCWERYASNGAAVAHYLESGGAGMSEPAAITFQEVMTRAASGDAIAGAALDRMARYLGLGLAGLITGLAPDVIVIVGELTAAWDRIGLVVEDVVRRNALERSATRVIPTDPAAQPRLRGAVTLVIQQHFGAPEVA